MKPIDANVVEMVKQDKARGMTQREIAAKHGISEASVSRFVGGSYRVTVAEVKEIMDEFQAGHLIKDIAERHEVSESTISRIITLKTEAAKEAANA